MVITDEMVEAAAKKIFLVDVEADGDVNRWDFYSTGTQNGYRRAARAVLEYAATLAPVAPPGSSVSEKLVSYRCAAMTGLLMHTAWRDDDAAVGNRAEHIAHAMLAAEKPVTP
jgi:hypothetical protein